MNLNIFQIVSYCNQFPGVNVSWCQCHNSTALSIQIDTLFAEYDREVPPPGAGALEVHVTLNVNHANIDQEQSVMRLLADLHLVLLLFLKLVRFFHSSVLIIY